MLTAINFHYIREHYSEPYPGIHGVTPIEFESQLDLLGQAFQYVSGADIDNAVKGKINLPKNALIVTFDDGLREQYELAWPILKEKGIPVIFYVNTRPILEKMISHVHQIHMVRAHTAPELVLKQLDSFLSSYSGIIPENISELAARQYRYDDSLNARLKYLLNFVLDENQKASFIEGAFLKRFGAQSQAAISESLYMTPEMILELSESGSLGTHGHDHLPLALLGNEDIKFQISESLDILSQWGCRNIQGISYPYGGRTAVSEVLAQISIDLGLSFGFTMERATNQSIAHPMLIARFSNSDFPGGNAPAWDIHDLPHHLPKAEWFSGVSK